MKGNHTEHEEHSGLNELACSCGHCHSDNQVIHNNTGSPFKDFCIVYGVKVVRLIISSIIFVLTLAITPKYPINLILFILSALVANYELVIDFFKNFIKLKFFDENALMTIASVSAFLLGEYFEGVLIVLLFTLGEFLEQVATDNSKKRIAGLKDLKVEICHLVKKEGIIDVSPEEVEIGSLIEVKKGERVPIDGVVLGLGSEFDMKAVTGESKLYSVGVMGEIYSGAINVGESCIIKTTKKHADSTVSKIINLVEGSLAKKAKSQKFIKVFAKYYTPIVVCIGFGIAILPALFKFNSFEYWIYKALNFIVISCPCALVVSVPLAFFIGIGSLAKRGVLVKGSSHIDSLCEIDQVVFDKTGTLTEGDLSVDEILYSDNASIDSINKVIRLSEDSSTHPVAKGIIRYLKDVKILKEERINSKINEISGKGICTIYQDKTYYLGNKSLMSEQGVEVNEDSIKTVVYLACDKKLLAIITLSDKVKESAKDCVKLLKKQGIKKVTMLSGDNAGIVNKVADEIGIENYCAELLPHQKAEKLEEILSKSNKKVMFVGDGINDSPSITLSDVGVSMGAIGSELAIETADVVIMDDDLLKVPYSIKSAKKIKRKVLQNIIGSIVVKTSIMILGLVISLPVSIAMFADVGVMLLAVGNSLLLSKGLNK